jgi:hypothetical protein
MQEGTGPGDTIDGKMVADLIEGTSNTLLGDGVSNACAGHTMLLGEGPIPDEIGPGRIEHGRIAGRRELDIGFVKNEDHFLGYGFNLRLQRIGQPPIAHWVVWVGEKQNLESLTPHGVDQGGRVLLVINIWHGDQPTAKARDLKIEGWIRAERRDGGIARLDE